MKIYVDAKTFLNTLKSIGKGWKVSSYQEILNYALLVVDDKIRLSRTNLDIFITLQIPGEVQETGKCLIPVKKTLAILKNRKGEIPLEFDEDYVKVGEFLLDTIPADDYPQPESANYTAIGTTQGHVLAYAIKKTALWLDRSGNTTLENFCLRKGQLIACNGHVLCLAETGLQHDQQFAIDNSLALLEKIDLQGEIQVAVSEKFLSLKGDNFEAYIRLNEVEYPNIEAVVPSKGFPLKVSAEALIDGIKEAINYAKAVEKSSDIIPVFLRWIDDSVEIYGEYEDKKAFRKTLAECQTSIPLSIFLNGVYLQKALKDLKGEITIWHPADNRTPVLITDRKTFKYLQMPISPGDNCDNCTGRTEECPAGCLPFSAEMPLQEIPYSPDLSAIPKPSKKAKRSGATKKVSGPSQKASSEPSIEDKILAELKAKADFWEAEALKKEEHIRNLEAELAKLQESYKALLQFQALRSNGKGRYAFINGHQFLFYQGKILDEDGNEVGHYDRKGNGELKGQSFKIQREYVIALN